MDNTDNSMPSFPGGLGNLPPKPATGGENPVLAVTMERDTLKWSYGFSFVLRLGRAARWRL